MNINKISSYSQNFRGYDAAPLKAVYIDEYCCSDIIPEMKKVLIQEDILLRKGYDNNEWAQDDKAIIEKDGKPFLLHASNVTSNFIDNLKYLYNINSSAVQYFPAGGNCFMGKYPDGEKWMLVGSKHSFGNPHEQRNVYSQCFNIKKENIRFLAQQNYHLDTYIRPVGYPKILVNDYSLVWENMKKIKTRTKEYNDLMQNVQKYQRYLNRVFPCSCDKTVKKLRELGFEPIRIAGEYGEAVNFINAIVNKHPDGTMSYITNSSKSYSDLTSKLQELFLQDLQSKVPDIKKVYFITGGCKEGDKLNYLMDRLKNAGGGVHCMTLEEPNFSTWA